MWVFCEGLRGLGGWVSRFIVGGDGGGYCFRGEGEGSGELFVCLVKVLI